jgi:hypothetical protein
VCGGGDRRPPTQRLRGKGRQVIDRLRVAVGVDEDAIVTVTGRIAMQGAARAVRLRTVRRRAAPGRRTPIRLRLFRRGRAAVEAALRSGNRVRVTVTVRARDRAGNTSTARKRIRLRP